MCKSNAFLSNFLRTELLFFSHLHCACNVLGLDFKLSCSVKIIYNKSTFCSSCRNGKLNLSFFSEKNQINTDLELIPTQKRILNLKLYKDNNGKEI